jgi:hypothetical protein
MSVYPKEKLCAEIDSYNSWMAEVFEAATEQDIPYYEVVPLAGVHHPCSNVSEMAVYAERAALWYKCLECGAMGKI